MLTQKLNGVVNARILDPNSGSISAPSLLTSMERESIPLPRSQTVSESELDGYYDAGEQS